MLSDVCVLWVHARASCVCVFLSSPLVIFCIFQIEEIAVQE